ncbi:hypothetical protein [Algirhabdus cladophorae]|uniref:hypothetical protein n=1 Tax=Algirhabdus cladophorae TaxID=3377108 RepID=UPI003B8455D7
MSITKFRVSPFILAGALGLAACSDGSGTNPFKAEEEEPVADAVVDPVATIDPVNPNVSEDAQFAFDETDGLVMNSFEFDAATNSIVINNLPFDGPGPTEYTLSAVAGSDTAIASTDATIATLAEFADVRSVRIYENVKLTGTDASVAQDPYYALFIRTDNFEASTTATSVYRDAGYGGALVQRLEKDVTVPTNGLYVFRGVYAGQRTFRGRGGLELVQGDAIMRYDAINFDLTGAVSGTIQNRVRKGIDGSVGASLPTITLAVTPDGLDGVVNEGGASTSFEGNARDTGTYTALLGATDATELAGYIVMDGVAEIQRVNYDQATFVDGSKSELTEAQRNIIIADLEAGRTATVFTIDPASDPNIASVETISEVFQTDYNARETGVFVTKQTGAFPEP